MTTLVYSIHYIPHFQKSKHPRCWLFHHCHLFRGRKSGRSHGSGASAGGAKTQAALRQWVRVYGPTAGRLSVRARQRNRLGRPYHPQTQGKGERFHRRLKEGICVFVYCRPDELRASIASAIETYNATPHEALKNVSPNDVYAGRQEEILKHRAEKKRWTLERRRRINLGLEQEALTWLA